jgi:hypothetical protein
MTNTAVELSLFGTAEPAVPSRSSIRTPTHTALADESSTRPCR